MYTVKELIEALQKCPQDYTVVINRDGNLTDLDMIGIDPHTGTVDLFEE